jgi:hypothetical protein
MIEEIELFQTPILKKDGEYMVVRASADKNNPCDIYVQFNKMLEEGCRLSEDEIFMDSMNTALREHGYKGKELSVLEGSESGRKFTLDGSKESNSVKSFLIKCGAIDIKTKEDELSVMVEKLGVNLDEFNKNWNGCELLITDNLIIESDDIIMQNRIFKAILGEYSGGDLIEFLNFKKLKHLKPEEALCSEISLKALKTIEDLNAVLTQSIEFINDIKKINTSSKFKNLSKILTYYTKDSEH